MEIPKAIDIIDSIWILLLVKLYHLKCIPHITMNINAGGL